MVATPAVHAGKSGGGYDVVGRVVGEGAETPPFWREYERVSAARDRARYDALKRSVDPYDRALAIYLAPRFGDMAFVEAALPDTRRVEHGQGCASGHEPIGKLAYDVIRERSEAEVPANARLDTQRRIALARTILRQPALSYLHGDAGVELGDLLSLNRNGEGCGAFEKLTAGQFRVLDAAQVGRLLTSVDLPWRQEDYRGDGARLLRGYVMACAITRPDIADEAKRYLIDFAYARAREVDDGRRFHAAAVRASLAPALAAYEREQYATFQKWKPLVAELEAIKTAREMHEHVAGIRRLFTADHPMLLSVVLEFGGSELHDSAALRKSRAEAVLRLIRACRNRGLYYADALAQARLRVLERTESRRDAAGRAEAIGFSPGDYEEMKRLLGLEGG